MCGAPSSARPPRRRSRRSAWPSRSPRSARSSPWRPRTNATPMRATRYGSSPNVSSVRPQRGSRQTSSTGERPWCAPVARICTRTASASASARSGSQVLASPIACGKIVASRAIRPEQISSWTIAGMPSRVSSTRWRWMALASAAACAAARLLAPEMRVTWPSPWRSRSAPRRRAGDRRRAGTPSALPSWATFSSSVIRAEQVVDPLVDRQRRVAVGGVGPRSRRWSSVERPTVTRGGPAGLADDEAGRQRDLLEPSVDPRSGRSAARRPRSPSAGSTGRSSSAAAR